VWTSLRKWSTRMAIGGACLALVYIIYMAWIILPDLFRLGHFVYDISPLATALAMVGIFFLLFGVCFRLIAKHECNKAGKLLEAMRLLYQSTSDS